MIEPNSVLIEPSTFLNSLVCLENNDKLSLKDFFNLTTFVESIVLNEKVYSYGVSRKYYNLQFLNLLKSSNIINFFIDDTAPYRKQLIDSYSPEFRTINKNEYDFRVLPKIFQESFINISNTHNIPYVPSIENIELVLEINELTQNDKIQSHILNYYKQVEKSLYSELKALKEMGRPIGLFIPPIMSIVLARSSSLNEFFNQILDLRELYHPLRKKFREYEIAIKDETISLKDSLKIVQRFKKEMELLTATLNSRDNRFVLEFCDFIKEVPIGFSDPTNMISSGNVIKFVLGKPAEWIINVYRKRKLSYFLSMKNKVKDIKNYNNLIKKTFGYEYSTEEVCSFYTKFKEIIF